MECDVNLPAFARRFSRAFFPAIPGAAEAGSIEDYMGSWRIPEVAVKLAANPGSIPLFVDYRVPVAELIAAEYDPALTEKMLTPSVQDQGNVLFPRVVYILGSSTTPPDDEPEQPMLHLREAVFFRSQYSDGRVFEDMHMSRFPHARQGDLVSRFYDGGCGGAYLNWVPYESPLVEGEGWIKVLGVYQLRA